MVWSGHVISLVGPTRAFNPIPPMITCDKLQHHMLRAQSWPWQSDHFWLLWWFIVLLILLSYLILERCSAQSDAGSSSPVSFLTPDSHGFQRVRDDLRRRHRPGGHLDRQRRHFNHRRYHHAKSLVHETEVIVEAFDSYHLLELVPVQVIGLTTCVNCHFVASRAFQKTNTFYVTYYLDVSEPVHYRLPRRIMN